MGTPIMAKRHRILTDDDLPLAREVRTLTTFVTLPHPLFPTPLFPPTFRTIRYIWQLRYMSTDSGTETRLLACSPPLPDFLHGSLFPSCTTFVGTRHTFISRKSPPCTRRDCGCQTYLHHPGYAVQSSTRRAGTMIEGVKRYKMQVCPSSLGGRLVLARPPPSVQWLRG